MTAAPPTRTSVCPGCGGHFPAGDGPTHRYLVSSPGCWACYGEVLAREYTDPALFAVHPLTVDAYALQHPGPPASPQAARSVALHALRLCAVFEAGLRLEEAAEVVRRAAQRRRRYARFVPPAARGVVTVADVHEAPDAHARLVRRWAATAWAAWADHHATIRAWLRELGT